MKKHKCLQCSRIATWYYSPWSSEKIEHENYYCEDHVSRGCSCNLIYPENIEERKDELGRLLPCCEYDWSEVGFDVREEPDEKYDHLVEEFEEE